MNNQSNYIKNVYEDFFMKHPHVVIGEDHPVFYHLLHFLPKDKSIEILDAACGDARYSLALLQNGYNNIFAVDLFLEAPSEKIRYRKCSIDNLPDEWGGKFDFIFCNAAIFYLDNPLDGIREFKRCLKRGGTMFFTSHTKYSLWTYWRKFKLLLGLKSVNHLKNVNFDRDVDEYKNWINECGMKLVYVSGYNLSIIYPYYEAVVKKIERYTAIKLPRSKNEITKNKEFGLFKAKHAYHSIIIAQNE